MKKMQEKLDESGRVAIKIVRINIDISHVFGAFRFVFPEEKRT